jgi:hypothetical protein
VGRPLAVRPARAHGVADVRCSAPRLVSMDRPARFVCWLLPLIAGDSRQMRTGAGRSMLTTLTPRSRHRRPGQMGSNRPRWGSVRLLEKRDGSSERSGADNYAHLQPSNDPSRFLTVRRTCPAGRVGSDAEEVTGSNPVAPTTSALTSGNAGQLAVRGRLGGPCTGWRAFAVRGPLLGTVYRMESVSLFNLPVHGPARPGPAHPLLRAGPLRRVRSSRTVMEWLRFRKSLGQGQGGGRRHRAAHAARR